MSSSNVLKRFPVDRIKSETYDEFLIRARKAMKESLDNYRIDNPELDVDCRELYIRSNDGYEIGTVVVEMIEIPITLALADNDSGYGSDALLIFHDYVKFQYSDGGGAKDIEPQEAMDHLIKNLNELEKAIIKVRGLIDAEDN